MPRLTYCNLRKNHSKVYSTLYNLQSTLCDLSINDLRDQLVRSMKSMQEYLSCPRCGEFPTRLTDGVFVSRCAHVYCKPCFALEGGNCGLCRG